MADEQSNRAEQKRAQAAHLRRIAKVVPSHADRGILVGFASSLEVEAAVLDEAVVMADKQLRLRAAAAAATTGEQEGAAGGRA